MAGYWLCVMMYIVMSGRIVLDNLRVNDAIFKFSRELEGLIITDIATRLFMTKFLPLFVLFQCIGFNE